MTVCTIDEAREALAITDNIGEVDGEFQGGDHTFEYDEGTAELSLNMRGVDYPLDTEALHSALRQIPGGSSDAIANKWPLEDLVLPALNWWFDNRQGEFKLITRDEDNAVFAFAKPNALVFNANRVFDAAVEAVETYGGKDEIIVSDFVHSVDETRFNIHPPHGWSSIFTEARPGDVTLGGVSFHGSLLGKHNVKLSCYTHRVECANGMISDDGLAKFGLGHGDEEPDDTLERMYAWVSATALDIFSGQPMLNEFHRLGHLAQQSIEGHAGDVLTDLYERLRVPSNAQDEINEALVEEADGTYYGLIQAMTRVAAHSDTLDQNARYNLMRLAGRGALLAQETCGDCRRPLTPHHSTGPAI